jgi:hypothetical protein
MDAALAAKVVTLRADRMGSVVLWSPALPAGLDFNAYDATTFR